MLRTIKMRKIRTKLNLFGHSPNIIMFGLGFMSFLSPILNFFGLLCYAQTYIVLFGSCSFLFFYVVFECYFSLSFHAVLTQCSSDSRDVCYIFSCSSGFIQNFLSHKVLVNVGSMIYMSRAYDVLFHSELLSN